MRGPWLPSIPPPMKRADRNHRQDQHTGGWHTVGTMFAVLAVYGFTLAPSVVGGDAGELVLGAAHGGVLHPPGYPLFGMLGKIFASLPWGELAWRVNFFSACMGALAAGILQRAVAAWGGSPWAGVVAAGCFAFAPTVWEHAVSAEVFSLHHVFVAVLLWLAVAYGRTLEARWVWWGAAVFGLGMSNHHTILFFGAPLAVWPFLQETGEWLKWRRMAGLCGLFLLGFLPYFALPLIAAAAPPVTWGDWSSWSGAWAHFTRADYGSLQLAAGEITVNGGYSARLIAWTMAQGNALGWIGLVLVAAGISWSVRVGNRALGWGILAAVAGYVIVFNYLANLPVNDRLMASVLARFWTMPHLVFSAWAGLGWGILSRRWPRWQTCGAVAVALLPAVWNFQQTNRREASAFSNYGQAWLAPLPENSVLLVRGDLIVNTATYRHHGTGLRPDLRLLDLERMSYPWYAANLAKRQPDLALPGPRYQKEGGPGYTLGELVAANPSLGPWFVAGDLTPGERATLSGWTLWPHGMGWRLVPPGNPVDLENWLRESERALPDFTPPDASVMKNDPWTAVVAADWWEARHRRAVRVLEEAIARKDPALFKRAIDSLTDQLAKRPEPPALMYKNLGLAWHHFNPAAPEGRAAFTRYVSLAAPAEPDAAVIRKWLAGP